MVKGKNGWVTSEKGSVMLMLVIAICIFSTLGLAVLSLSVSNLKASQADKKSTASFYMADSGLEQAYSVVLDNVRKAVVEANKVVDTLLEDFINSERQKMIADASYRSEYIMGDDPTGPVNVEKINETLKTPTDPVYQMLLSRYQDKYKKVLVNSVVNSVDDQQNYKSIDPSNSNSKPKITVEKVSDPAFSGNDYVLTVSSLYDKEKLSNGNTVAQKVQMDFAIHVPAKIPDMITNNENEDEDDDEDDPENGDEVRSDDNPLFNQVFVVSKKDLLFEGYTDVVINGNCYAHGTMGNENDLNSHGGVILHKPKNKVTINGDIAAFYAVQHQGTLAKESQNAWLDVNGNVYAQQILVNSNVANARITVGNAYTANDLLMYGKNGSKIIINNDWYKTANDLKRDASLSPEYDGTPASLDKLVSVNGQEYDPSFSAILNEFVEMRRKQFSHEYISNYLVDVGEIIPEKVTKGQVITDEIVMIDNHSKGVYIVGPELHGLEIPAGSVKVKVGKDPVKVMIIAKGNVYIYSSVNFSGLILTKEGEMQIRCEHKKTFNADPDYLKKIASDLDKYGKNPFKYTRPTGDNLPWPTKVYEGKIPQNAEYGIRDSVNFEAYKALITVSDWQLSK